MTSIDDQDLYYFSDHLLLLQVVPTKSSNLQSTPSNNIEAKYPNENSAVDSKQPKDMTYQFFEELIKQQEESNNR